MKCRPGKGVFVRPASCLSDSEFLPGWKKCPCLAGTTIKAMEDDLKKKTRREKGLWPMAKQE
jgi:hypothetical protein